MKLVSSAFKHNGDIPKKYTCQGDDMSPPLEALDVPMETVSLVLICEDPDAPDPEKPKMVWDHWVVFNIPPDDTVYEEDSVPGSQALNSWGRSDYGGPCPPIGKHRYFFKLFALDTDLPVSEEATKAEVLDAMNGHVIAKAELVGLYEKE